MEKRFIQIYTGNGKGKTTAALGLALRAAGAGIKTLFIQFMKEGFTYSELDLLPHLNDWIRVEQYGSDAHVLEKRKPTSEEKEIARCAIARTLDEFNQNDFDMIVLDEICVAVHFGLIEEGEVNPIFDHKPDNVELVLTGRYCPEAWIEVADLVTEMKEVKHYYQKDVLSRKGFDS